MPAVDRARGLLVLGAISVLAAGSASTAGADNGSPPQGVPAISEYVEAQPTAEGPKVSQGHSKSANLSPSVASSIEKAGGSDAATLRGLVGATTRRRKITVAVPTHRRAAVAAAVGEGGQGTLYLALGGAASLAFAAALAIALRRRALKS